MSAARKWNLTSIDEYLAGELISPVKHEYVGGVIYAMAGARNVHNVISGNIFGSLYLGLRGKCCRPFNSDTKIRVHLPMQIRFYYPDVSVVCNPNPPLDSFQDEPIAIFEVLSAKTRRLDEGEKKDAYLSIPSLAIYTLVESETAAVVVHRRTTAGFVREVHEGMAAVLPLTEIDLELPLADIYDGVVFAPEPAEEE